MVKLKIILSMDDEQSDRLASMFESDNDVIIKALQDIIMNRVNYSDQEYRKLNEAWSWDGVFLEEE